MFDFQTFKLPPLLLFFYLHNAKLKHSVSPMKSKHFYFRHSLLSLLSFLEASLQLIKKCHANDSFGCLSFQNFKVNIKLLFVIVRKWLFNLWMKKKTKDWLSFIDISLCKFFIKNKSKPRTDELKGQNIGSSDLHIFDLNSVWCDFEDIIFIFIFLSKRKTWINALVMWIYILNNLKCEQCPASCSSQWEQCIIMYHSIIGDNLNSWFRFKKNQPNLPNVDVKVGTTVFRLQRPGTSSGAFSLPGFIIAPPRCIKSCRPPGSLLS